MGEYLSSTEVRNVDSPVWTMTTPLPRAVNAVRGVTVGGNLFMTGKSCALFPWLTIFCVTGGQEEGYNNRGEIHVWVDEEQEWEGVGKMKMARSVHAVTTIQMDDQAMDHC